MPRDANSSNRTSETEAIVADLRPLTPIKPDYSQAWVLGHEHISQEGTTFWQRKREEKGWTREDVHELTDWQLDPNTLGLIEGDYGPGTVWELDHLTTLAVLYGMRPGEMLDACFEEKGFQILEEDDA